MYSVAASSTGRRQVLRDRDRGDIGAAFDDRLLIVILVGGPGHLDRA